MELAWLVLASAVHSAFWAPIQNGEPRVIKADGGRQAAAACALSTNIRRAKELTAKRIHYVDIGTSGVWALERGYCMIAGGEADTVKYLDPIFATPTPGCMFNTFLSILCQKTQGLRELD